MDNENKLNIMALLKEPYVKVAIIISIIVIVAMYATQAYWMGAGIKIIYSEYQAEEVLPTDDVPEGVFILSGNYSYISHWINTSKLNCAADDNVKLLVMGQKEFGSFINVIVMESIEGCSK